MADEDDERVAFHVSETEPSYVARVFVVLVHQLTNRSTCTDLERVLKRLALRRGERVYISLGITSTAPKATVKAANKLCTKHTVVHHDAERPLAAAARALKDVDLHANDWVVVLRDVLPDTDFVDELVSTIAHLPSDVDMLTLTPSTYVGFAASASLLSSFCNESPVLAAHPDADILLQCFAVGSGEDTRTLRAVVRDDGRHLVAPLGSYLPVVQPDDIDRLERVLTRLCLHVASEQLPTLQQVATSARTLLRRNAAAHLRSNVPSAEALRHILHGRHLGIVDFVRRVQTPAIVGLIPGILIDVGLRRFAEELNIRVDDDKELTRAIIAEFPELSRRLSELTRRAVKKLAGSGIADDNPRAVKNG